MKNNPKQHRTGVVSGILLPLGLICLFAFCSLFLTILGTEAYSSVQQQIDDDFGVNVTTNYLRTKLSRANTADAVEIREVEGIQVLVIATRVEDVQFETRIYVYNGQLIEDYVDRDVPLRAPGEAGGTTIAQVDYCRFELTDDNLLTVDIRSQNGARSRLVFALLEGGGT